MGDVKTEDTTGFGAVAKAGASVINNFMDKISDAIGYLDVFAIDKGVKEGHKSIIEEISKRTDINPVERGAIISNYKNIIKQYKNKKNIVEKAIFLLDKETYSSDVDDSWIDFFFDHAKYSSDEEMQNIWAQILAGEFNNPNSIPKSVIHTISIIDKDAAYTFSLVMDFSLMINDFKNEIMTIMPYNNNADYFSSIGLNYSKLIELERYGLITFVENKIVEIKEIELKYCNKIIKIKNKVQKDEMDFGNILLTHDGEKLAKVIYNPEYDEDKLSVILKTWDNPKYIIEVTDIE